MRPDKAVLELGCGTGSTALTDAAHVPRIDATDVSAAMIAIGLDKAERAGIPGAPRQASDHAFRIHALTSALTSAAFSRRTR